MSDNIRKNEANVFFRPEDKDYMIRIRRELHEYPEIEYDLPRTVALVERELSEMGIPYTKEYGISSIVGTVGPEGAHPVIGIRAAL